MQYGQYSFDAVVVGGGGAGLRAALQLATEHVSVAVISKVFPTRSHTVSAQGGITAALANVDEDDWHWHMFDTVKGSDYLGDQEAIEYMCEMGPEVVYELEHMGLPFSRMENGKIYQRPFGGQSKNFGGAQATRTCAAADRTGHAMLHTLYQQNLKAKTTFFSEWYAIDLLKNDRDQVGGVAAVCIETGEVVFFRSKAVILATGGAGRIYQYTTNALANTGDGPGMVLRAGLPLQDMEMWQFHPTGIAGAGPLVTEGARGEGGYLVNKLGERFMERYAPSAKDLASRDVVSRAIAVEILEGRGCGPRGNYVLLKIDHLGADIIKSRLPGICELAMTFAQVDPIHEPIPVVPTSHYMMGGIPTNLFGQALTVDEQGMDKIVEGLYAVGECACVSVHGANRLGGNSLLDLIVFGRAAGLSTVQSLREGLFKEVNFSEKDLERALICWNRWEKNKDEGESPHQIRIEMQEVMQTHFGVFRTESHMQKGLERLKILTERLLYAALKDKSTAYNTARIEALELDNLMAVALATAFSAFHRTESRGAHARDDYPKRDDEHWLKHTLYFPGDGMGYRAVNRKPKRVAAYEPKARTY